MENNYVSERTCEARHAATDGRLTRVEEDTGKQWDTIDKLRDALQKQAVQIAIIVGGVSAVVQTIGIMVLLHVKANP